MHETDEERIRRLIKYVKSQSVNFDRRKNDILAAKKWCLENVGEQRSQHPIWEAAEGWLDFFEGDWAVDSYYYLEPNQNNIASFWFSRTEDRVQFQLIWGS